MASAGSIFVDLLLRDGSYQQGWQRATRTTNASTRMITNNVNKLSSEIGALVSPVNAVSVAFRSLAGVTATAFSIQGIIRYSDTWKQLQGRLSIVEKDMQSVGIAQDALFEIAQRNRQPLADVINFYQRLNQFVPESVRGQYDLLGVTENVTAALAITGETSLSAQAALVQFTQAIGTNFEASGQELRTLQEQAPRLAQALQNALGDGTKSLQQLKKEGLLTRDSVLRSMSGMGEEGRKLAEELAKIPVTVGQGFAQVNNALLVFIGRSKGISGATSILSSSLTLLSENIELVANSVLFLTSVVGVRLFSSWTEGFRKSAKETAILYSTVLSGNTTLVDSAKAVRLKTAAEVLASKESVAATQARIAALRQEAAQYNINLGVIAKQRKQALAAVELARGISQTGMSSNVAGAITNSNDQLRAELATKNILRQTNIALAAETNTLAAAEIRLAAATNASNIASRNATILRRSLGLLNRSLLGITAIVGGPYQAAFLAAGAAVYYLFTRTTELEKALELQQKNLSEVSRLTLTIASGTERQAEKARKEREDILNEARARVTLTSALLAENEARVANSKFRPGIRAMFADEGEELRKNFEAARNALADLEDEINSPRGGNIPVPGLSESQAEKTKKIQDELNQIYDRNRKYLDGLTDSQRQWNDKYAEFQTLYAAGRINDQERLAALQKLREEIYTIPDELNESLKRAEDYSRQASENIQDAFAEFLFDPFKDGMAGMLKGWVDTLRKMVAERTAADLLGGKGGIGDMFGSIFGASGGSTGIGSFLFGNSPASGIGPSSPGLFGGFFADGGFLNPGQWGIAGEAGAEMIYGGKTGMTVVPQGGNQGNVYNIDARGADQGAVTRMEMALLSLAGPGVIEKRVNNAQRRGGLAL